MQGQVMEASKQADPEKQPVDLIDECTKLLAQLTEPELALHMSPGFQSKPAEEQLLLFYRAVRCVHSTSTPAVKSIALHSRLH